MEDVAQTKLPPRRFNVELIVGAFTMAALAAMAYLAIGLGGMQLGMGNRYTMLAEFDNVSGLEHGASVELAGVRIGDVASIRLDNSLAIVEMRINRNMNIYDEDILSIRTKGIIGDRYIRVSRGASDTVVAAGARIIDTESVVDFEDVIGKIVHSFTGGSDE